MHCMLHAWVRSSIFNSSSWQAPPSLWLMNWPVCLRTMTAWSLSWLLCSKRGRDLTNVDWPGPSMADRDVAVFPTQDRFPEVLGLCYSSRKLPCACPQAASVLLFAKTENNLAHYNINVCCQEISYRKSNSAYKQCQNWRQCDNRPYQKPNLCYVLFSVEIIIFLLLTECATRNGALDILPL